MLILELNTPYKYWVSLDEAHNSSFDVYLRRLVSSNASIIPEIPVRLDQSQSVRLHSVQLRVPFLILFGGDPSDMLLSPFT